MSQESGKHWEEIKNNTYLFDRKRQLVSVLQSAAQPLALSHVLAFYDRFLVKGPLRKKFSSQFYGSKTKYSAVPPKVQLVQDGSLFKRSMPLFPVQVFEPAAVADGSH